MIYLIFVAIWSMNDISVIMQLVYIKSSSNFAHVTFVLWLIKNHTFFEIDEIKLKDVTKLFIIKISEKQSFSNAISDLWCRVFPHCIIFLRIDGLKFLYIDQMEKSISFQRILSFVLVLIYVLRNLPIVIAQETTICRSVFL